MTEPQIYASDLLFDALVNAPVSDREWAEVLVSSAIGRRTMFQALCQVYALRGLYISPSMWDKIHESSQRLNPAPPPLPKATTPLVLICNDFTNASTCVFAKKSKEAVDWILSGKDSKRAVMPKKKTKKPFTGARLTIEFRNRDDRTAWNKCK